MYKKVWKSVLFIILYTNLHIRNQQNKLNGIFQIAICDAVSQVTGFQAQFRHLTGVVFKNICHSEWLEVLKSK